MAAAGWLPGILAARAAEEPARVAYRFLVDGTSGSAVSWSYAELYERASAVARFVEPGTRVVLALPPGLDYVAALFGVLLAGATAVPAYPPASRRTTRRVSAIVGDCAPCVVIAESCEAVADLGVPVIVAPVGRSEPARRVPDEPPSAPAVLQYTSGSTDDPKAIALTHANLVSNCRSISVRIGEDPDRVGVSWLPPYHDMGMIGTLMLALYGGWPLVMMSPGHFVQRPSRWLQAVSDYRATISVAPNFALEMCDAEDAVGLSSLRHLFCGSEPISPAALRRFQERFEPYGFNPAALIPCYGLAEATLMVTARAEGDPLRFERLDGTEVVSCGRPASDVQLRIVEPESGRALPEGEVGEIRVSGPGVAAGYYQRPELTARTFEAGILRTGDLGYLRGGELFVTGRLSDLVIIAGRNLYPHDIERSVLATDARIRRAVAFSVPGPTEERLVVMAEVRRADELAQLEGRIVAAVTADHGVRPSDVRLVRPGAIAMTTSGKPRRRHTREEYLSAGTR
ncbi:fatty acyl-AMP ligase [Micromonospora olivasterospora]|uniref:Acyl-CoA synthetase (AMP-forming)/AMP-acid ligase II n=1 Tax=Micromonospora olivasterospora TaxID=1880 RepID=A0A562I830_MICOL|nr:fatty acyl-AMP ligase [Micromonospora olivasterospora]TWH67177.1 acyl-CoA synthetase (AMP-forming)/AMP-acid ligase II [Micromonospora olivasterospora]